jgi:hypothetical protein
MFGEEAAFYKCVGPCVGIVRGKERQTLIGGRDGVPDCASMAPQVSFGLLPREQVYAIALDRELVRRHSMVTVQRGRRDARRVVRYVGVSVLLLISGRAFGAEPLLAK